MKRTPAKEQKAISKTAWHDAEDLRWAVRNWAARIGVKPARIQVRAMQSKWASISTNGSMTLDLDLLRLPQELGEFVIVHELVHLLVPNHGRVFKSLMHAYIPEWELLETQLQTYANKELNGKVPRHTNSNSKKKLKQQL